MAKSRRLIWMLVILLILASSAAAATIYTLLNQSSSASGTMAGDMEASAETMPVAVEPIYAALKPFTVNLAEDNGGPRILYVGITLQTDSEAGMAAIERDRPQIRNRVLLILSNRKAEGLVTPEQKQRLATDLTNSLSELIADNHSAANISRVLFTEFIVQ